MNPKTALTALNKPSSKRSLSLSISLAAKSIAATWLGLSFSCASAAPVTMPTYSEANSDLVNRGAYVARQADCMGCHREDYSGGIAVETPMGEIYATNITPSLRYGIGDYTEQDLKQALTKGKTPSHHLYPAMPYPAYSNMTDTDIHALFEYLQTVRPIDEAPEYETQLKFPFNIRPLMIGWNILNMPKWEAREGLTKQQQQGQYLVDNLAHCGTCHTPRNKTMGYNTDKYLAGAQLGNAFAPNITPDNASGIGNWSEDEIVSYLRDGEVHNKALAAGPMSEVVMNSTRYLKDEDLQAIASYLKQVPAIETEDTLQPLNTAVLPQKHSDDISFDLLQQIDYLEAANSQAQSPSESLYLANCASCHGVNGYGQPDAGYASIVGLTTLRRDNPAPVINVIANGVHDVVNTRPRMPGFKNDLSNDEIASLVNYVRTKFGGLSDSQVNGTDIDTYLKEGPKTPFIVRNAGWLAGLGIIVALVLILLLIRRLIRRD